MQQAAAIFLIAVFVSQLVVILVIPVAMMRDALARRAQCRQTRRTCPEADVILPPNAVVRFFPNKDARSAVLADPYLALPQRANDNG